MIVVADTSPICYLLLINCIQLLPQLYGQVLIPVAVQQELASKDSPKIIQDWIAAPPNWLVVTQANLDTQTEKDLEILDRGELEAIVLAEQHQADLLIMDERVGRQVAKIRGLNVTGLLGVIDTAAKYKLIDFNDTINKLESTIAFLKWMKYNSSSG